MINDPALKYLNFDPQRERYTYFYLLLFMKKLRILIFEKKRRITIHAVLLDYIPFIILCHNKLKNYIYI